ncbi:CCAAT/enhancer-binding protein zeta-like [Amphiura filiformis]|uniref:CCAAT/enhancer-binding protein zeta-like n=1 Tax=Amphiura filiformis TaxID=82378 RepID=UPI003B21AFFA
MATTTAKKLPHRRKGSKKRSKEKDSISKRDLSKEAIKTLGGNDEDYDWLQDVEDTEEDFEGGDQASGSEKDFDVNQLKNFVQNLGFDQLQAKKSNTGGKTSKDAEEEEEASDDTTSDDDQTSQPKLTKSNQNRTTKSDQQSKRTGESDQSKQGKNKKTRAAAVGNSQDADADERTSKITSKKQKRKDLRREGKIQHAEISSTTSSPVLQRTKQDTFEAWGTRKLLKGYRPRNYLLISRSEEKWYDNQFSLHSNQFEAVDASVVSEYSKLAARLYQDEVAQYTKLSSSNETTKEEWMRKVVASGVLSDKVAALTLQTQKSPVHNANTLDTLLNMVRKKGRREALLALKDVKQLFLEELLPDDRKLKMFSQHPFLELDKKSHGKLRDERDRCLLYWYFEAQLKQKYEAFVTSLETMCHDNVSAVKQKAVAAMEELLASKPEQEKILLTQIVNKIGDPDNKVASKSVYLLHKLIENQVAMKGVVVKAVEGLLYRVNVRAKAQYYAMCFLNQMILTHKDADLASKLIVIYFSFFKSCTKKRDIDQKMLSAVLTGVNRAYPFAKVDDTKMEAEINTIFKVVHKSPFNIGVQALLLLKQVLGESYSISDRFYSAMYKKILDPTLDNSPRQPMFLNLLYQTLKADSQVKRNKAFVKRLLQVCESQQPAFICGALFLISELVRLKPGLKTIIQIAAGDDDDEEHFVDIAPESDVDDKDDDEEAKKPTQDDATEDKTETSSGQDEAEQDRPSGSSWVHHKVASQDTKIQTYDPLGRNPLYCGAESSALWELQKLSKHYHPSVVLFAEALLRGDTITYTGNPLQDFTLMKFLERFVYKNPKQSEETEKGKGSSVMQPQTKNYKPSVTRQMAVNSSTFINTPEDQIPIDELFFHRFFQQRGKRAGNTKVDNDDEDEDDDDLDGSDVEIDSEISDDEFDKILDGMEKEGEDEDAFDFAGEFTRKQKSGKKDKKKAGGSDDEDDDEDGASSDDEDYLNPDLGDSDDSDDVARYDYDDADEFKMEGAEQFDEEGFGASDSEDRDLSPPKQKKLSKSKPTREEYDSDSDSDEELQSSKKRKKGKQAKKMNKKQRKGGESTSLKTAAEEIATLMDDNVGSKFDSIGLQAMANKDKADLKQLDWEMKRDMWVRGTDAKSKIREKMGAKREQGGGKRPFNKGRKRQHNRNQKGSKGKGKQQRKK